MVREQIPALIRRFRRHGNLTQSALAKLLDVTQGTVSRWEKGQQAPDRHQFARLVALIGRGQAGDRRHRVPAVEESFGLRLLVGEGARLLCGSRRVADLLEISVEALRGAPLGGVMDEAGAGLVHRALQSGFPAGPQTMVRGPARLATASGGGHDVHLALHPFRLPVGGIAVLAELTSRADATGPIADPPAAAGTAAGTGPDAAVGTADPADPASRHSLLQAPARELVQSRLLLDFYRLWMRLGEGSLRPTAARFLGEVLPDALRLRLCRFSVTPDRGPRLDSAGPVVAAELGADFSGQYVDEVPDLEAGAARLRHLLRTGVPYLARSPITWSSDGQRHYEAVVCPLFDAHRERVVAAVSTTVLSSDDSSRRSKNDNSRLPPPPGDRDAAPQTRPGHDAR